MDVLLLLVNLIIVAGTDTGESLEPSFDVPIVNVTIIAGKTAVLPCSVDFLGEHKILWMDHRDKVMTFGERRIIFDDRISLERPYSKDWNVHIRNVNHADSGRYKCQIQTTPPKTKFIQLYVQEPAKIIEELSSKDQTVQEGETVQLICNTTGIPTPTVTWYRRSLRHMDEPAQEVARSGEVLLIHNISRYCGDIYECVAFNEIQPEARRQIRVTVEFPPEVYLPNRRIGQLLGLETILECRVTANPQTYSAWKRNGHEIDNDWKYRVVVFEENENTITLSLRIRPIDKEDYGDYVCVSNNKLGSDREKMFLYQYEVRKTTPLPIEIFPPVRPSVQGPDSVDRLDKTTKDIAIKPIPPDGGFPNYGHGKPDSAKYGNNGGNILFPNFSALSLVFLVLTLVCTAR
ncbi:hypothetical protein ScPMuIL_018130 [Solemya velum]